MVVQLWLVVKMPSKAFAERLIGDSACYPGVHQREGVDLRHRTGISLPHVKPPCGNWGFADQQD